MLNGLYNNFLKFEKPNIPLTEYWAKFCLVFTKFVMHCHCIGVALVLRHCLTPSGAARLRSNNWVASLPAHQSVASLLLSKDSGSRWLSLFLAKATARFADATELKLFYAKAVLFIVVLFSNVMEITTFVNTTKHFCSKTTISVMW